MNMGENAEAVRHLNSRSYNRTESTGSKDKRRVNIKNNIIF
jgi:hypothetical protein